MHRLVAIATCLLASGLALGAPQQPAVSVAGEILPIEYFTHSNSIGGVKISPTGEYVAWLTGKNAHEMIAVLNLKEKKITGGVKCPRAAEQFEIYDFDWVSPTRLIYRMAEQLPWMPAAVPTGEIMAMDFDGGRQKLIYGWRADDSARASKIRGREASYASALLVRTFTMDGKTVMIAEYPWLHRADSWYSDPDAKPAVFRLDLGSGRKEVVDTVPLAGASVLVDRNDHVRFAIGKNERHKEAVSWKPRPTSAWAVFDLPGFRGESITPRVFGPDNESVLFTGAREGETHTALYSLDLKSQAVAKVFAFEHASIGRLIFDFSGKNVVGVSGDTEDPIYHWLNDDDRAVKVYKALLRAFPNQQVEVTSTADDGRTAIVFVDSDVNPGDYYVFDTQTMRAARLQGVRPWVDPARMRPKAPFSMHARDGLELHGYVTKPAGDGPYPLVMLPHGGPHGVRDTWSYDSEAQLLASRGYAVLQVNFRGSGGYGIDFENAGYREWGAKIQEDITDATRWAIEQKIAAPDRIAIFGASFGGYAALMGAEHEPKLYRCAIGYAGVYDLELMYSSGDVPRSNAGWAFLEKALGTDHDELKARSPVNMANAIEVPVLLIHGKDDQRADFKQATRMRAALEAAGKPVEWVALSHGGHGIFDEETRRDVYERVLQFLDKNLAVSPSANGQ